MGRHSPKTVADLVTSSGFLGTSLILRGNGLLLYGVRPPKQEKGHAVLELTGIGGAVEAEDESLTASVQREAREEIGSTVRLLGCSETLVAGIGGTVERVVLQGSERPVAVVFRHHRTPPHHPWHRDHQGQGSLVVFLAELRRQPCPSLELPGLIWLRPNQVPDLARRDVSLGDLLDCGARLLERRVGALRRDARTRLTDSQEALAQALGSNAPRFFETLARSETGH
jgi:8-oxo-dGTP pyrophosphatase MutT (NUDIX family)